MIHHRLSLAGAAALCALAAGCDAAPRTAQAAPAAPVAGEWSAPRGAPALSAALGRRDGHSLAAAAVDAAGTLHAVFASDQDHDGWADALAYARLDSAGWSAPKALAGGATLAEAPQVAVEGDGTVHVLWYGHTGTASPAFVPTQLVHRALRAGRWSAPSVLYREPLEAGIPDLSLSAATGPNGAVEVLFQAQGRGIGHLSLRGGRASAPEFLDHDGRMTAFAAVPAGRPLELAYVGEAVTPLRPSAEFDVFVRPLRSTSAFASVEVHSVPRRYSHFPQLVVDGRGVRHLFWLEDTDGQTFPEALYHATSRDGRRWTAAEDVTPAPLRGGVLMRFAAVPGAGGRIHLAVRHTRGLAAPEALHAFSLTGGRASPLDTLAGAGAFGGGDAQLVHDRRHRRVIALWRGADGLYRSAVRAE
ncbi:MAG TPA: hypothetical protein VFR37_04665 [Longimicrobium sp.]|nr:hypothetical protein [Longimicrobium sp.]